MTLFLEDSKIYLDYLKRAENAKPGTLNLELTTHCNLRCIMCPKSVGFGTHQEDYEIKDEVLDRIIEQVLPSVHHINLMGFGEPLLEKAKVLKLLAECSKQYITVNLISNGQLLDNDTAEKLVDHNLFNLNISLDAATSETYKKIRKSNFAKVINNLKYLKEYKEKSGKIFPTLDLSFVGMTENINEFPQFIRLASELGAKKVVLQAMSEVPESLVHLKDVFITNREIGLNYYREALQIAEELGITIELFPPDQFEIERNDTAEDDHIIPKKDGRSLVKTCKEPWNAVFISSEGDIAPCCGLKGYGDLTTQQSFQEIWNGSKMTSLRGSLKTDKIPKLCIYCRGEGWREKTELKEEIIPGETDNQLGYEWFNLEELNGERFFWVGKVGNYFIRKPDESCCIEAESFIDDQSLTIEMNSNACGNYSIPAAGVRHYYFIPADKPGEEVEQYTLRFSKDIKPAEISGADGRRIAGRFFGHYKIRELRYKNGDTMLCGISPAGLKNSNSSARIKIISGLKSEGKKKRILNIFIIKEKSRKKGIIPLVFYPASLVQNILKKRSFRVQAGNSEANPEELNEYIVDLSKMKAGKYLILASIIGSKKEESGISKTTGFFEIGRIDLT